MVVHGAGARAACACSLFACLLSAACAARPVVRRMPVRTPAEISAGAVAGSDPDRPVPLDSLLPSGTITTRGFLTVHAAGERAYFEVPDTVRSLLLVVEDTAGTPTTRVIRLEHQATRILLREVPADILPAAGAIGRAVDALRAGDILAAFPIRSTAANGAPVIDATPLFTGRVGDLAALPDVDGSRSFITGARAAPLSVEVAAVQTGTVQGPAGRGDTRTVAVHFSLLPLPGGGFAARAAGTDSLWTSVRAFDYGSRAHRVIERRWIRRFRLPVVFDIDPATPAWAVPFIAAGIEEWRAAFDGIGLPDAIRISSSERAGGDAPFTGRRATVRWLPSTADSCTVGIVADPRTGEILRTWIAVPHGLTAALERRWFVAAASLDSAARTLPMPGARAGVLLQAEVARAVGRALGLAGPRERTDRFPVDSLRSAAFLARAGPAPSILADPAVHVVARPRDGIPPDLLLPHVGPLDRLALARGYAGDGAIAPADSAAWQELLETRPPDDEVRAADLALANLADAAARAIDATVQPGRDYADLAALYSDIVARWRAVMLGVVERVGGGRVRPVGGGAPALQPVTGAETRSAISFLSQRAFTVPPWLLDPAVLRRIEAEGSIARIAAAQEHVLRRLLERERLGRLADAAARADDVVSPAELHARVREALWAETGMAAVHIDVFRRALQRTHVDVLARALQERATSDARAAARQVLVELREEVRAAQTRSADPATGLHFADVEREITRALEPARESP